MSRMAATQSLAPAIDRYVAKRTQFGKAAHAQSRSFTRQSTSTSIVSITVSFMLSIGMQLLLAWLERQHYFTVLTLKASFNPHRHHVAGDGINQWPAITQSGTRRMHRTQFIYNIDSPTSAIRFVWCALCNLLCSCIVLCVLLIE